VWDLGHLTELIAIKMHYIATLKSAASEATDVPHHEQVSPRIRQDSGSSDYYRQCARRLRLRCNELKAAKSASEDNAEALTTDEAASTN